GRRGHPPALLPQPLRYCGPRPSAGREVADMPKIIESEVIQDVIVVEPEAHGDDRGLFIPPGVAHGFASLTDLTLWYLVDGYYNPEDELGVAWDDPAIHGDWGVTDPVLSARDQANPRRDGLPAGRQPRAGLRT